MTIEVDNWKKKIEKLREMEKLLIERCKKLKEQENKLYLS